MFRWCVQCLVANSVVCTYQAFGHPHEPLARWLVPRFGTPPTVIVLYCTVCLSSCCCRSGARVKSLMYTLLDYPDGREFGKNELKVCSKYMVPMMCCLVVSGGRPESTSRSESKSRFRSRTNSNLQFTCTSPFIYYRRIGLITMTVG